MSVDMKAVVNGFTQNTSVFVLEQISGRNENATRFSDEWEEKTTMRM